MTTNEHIRNYRKPKTTNEHKEHEGQHTKRTTIMWETKGIKRTQRTRMAIHENKRNYRTPKTCI